MPFFKRVFKIGSRGHHHHGNDTRAAEPQPTATKSKPVKSAKKGGGPKAGEPGSREKPKPVSTCGNKSYTRGDDDYDTLKSKLLSSGKLYEDPDFPAGDAALFFSQRPPRRVEWKRPHEIVSNPKLFVEGASRFDVKQGELGDCWLLAAIASLTLNEQLLHNIVPNDQSFRDGDYCGAFHFQFWQYGCWVDVVVDDLLPTYNGQLVYMHSAENNEFWTALMEKAYAKLHGSYESLKGGSSCEAMEDFTGGVTEMFDLQEAPEKLFAIMKKALQRGSLMGCSIEADPRVVEAQLANGLIRGHAYSVTSVAEPDIQTARMSGKMQLVRVRNPWGNEAEWKGAWGDQSREWQLISADEKKKMGLTFDDDGEFWMSYKDFIANFMKLEICNLGPDALDDESGRKWEMIVHEGSWVRGCTAGGCRNFIDTFWTNPQFRLDLVDPDDDDDDDMCTAIIAVLQKGRRQKRKEGEDLLTIGYSIYRLKEEQARQSEPLGVDFFKYNASVARSPTFINIREISSRFKLPPGNYFVIPSTFDPNEIGEFVVRIFSEKESDSNELDEETGYDETVKEKEKLKPMKPPTRDQEVAVKDFFTKVAGEDLEIDYEELHEVLNTVLKKEFEFEGFSLECCRSMVAMMDEDRSGKLGLTEFRELWQNIRWWKQVFKDYDKDKSGNLNTFELRQALHSAGYRLSTRVYQMLVLRYGNKQNTINFDDFVICAVKLKSMIDKFNKMKKNDVDLNDWVEMTMYT